MAYEVVYIGGPRHGEREAREGDVFDAPVNLVFPVYKSYIEGGGEAVYTKRVAADTPGAIAYVFGGNRWSG
jgi:hypothetical protein